MASPYPPSPEIVPNTVDARAGTNERVERCALVLIVLVVGALAGRASFSHVVDWSMRNLPDGTSRSYGYTNATVSELLPVGVLLFVRFQRRHRRQPGALVWSMLVGAGGFSVTAQLAVATPSPSGWLVAAVPTLAFMALTKLLLSMKPSPVERHVPTPPVRAHTKPSATIPTRDPSLAAPPGPEVPAGRPPIKGPPDRRRVTAGSLTKAAAVAAAVAQLGPDAGVTQVAAHAGVGESTARRHMKNLASPSRQAPAQTAISRENEDQLLDAGST